MPNDVTDWSERRYDDRLVKGLVANINELTESHKRHDTELLRHADDIRRIDLITYKLQEEQRKQNDRLENHWAGIQAQTEIVSNVIKDGVKKHRQMAVTSFVILFVVAFSALKFLT